MALLLSLLDLRVQQIYYHCLVAAMARVIAIKVLVCALTVIQAMIALLIHYLLLQPLPQQVL